MQNTARKWLCAAMALTVVACGDDEGTNPTNPGFAVTLSSQTLSVEQGASAPITATIARTGSFSGTVTLLAEAVPTGLTATFSPSQVTSAVTTATLTVAAASTLAPGTYNFTIRGQAAGLTDQTFSATVTVTARPAVAVALVPPTATVIQGGNTSYVANITRANFTGAVTVAVTGAPTGVTTTVTPNANAYTVAVGVATSTAPGTYQLVTTATGTGVTAAVANFALIVTAAPASISLTAAPDTVTLTTGNVETTINIARTSFAGAVTLAATGVPTGITATITTSPTTTNSAVVGFSATTAIAPGNYPVIITGSGTGISNKTVTVVIRVPAPAAVVISAVPDSLNFNASGTVSTRINIARTNFTGAVTLAATGVPAGVTASFTTSPTTSDSARLNFASGLTAPVPGAYTVTVTASGTGITNSTTQVRLIVPAAVGVSLTPTPSSLTIAQGGMSTTTLAIARSAFTGAVAFSATAPTGVTVTFNPNNTTTNTTTATVSVSGSAALGAGVINITATGTGIVDATVQIPITVTAATAGNITYTFCGNAGNIPVWLAVQDGSGSWTVVTGVNSGSNKTFSFTITNNGGVAWVTLDSNGDPMLNISYGVLSEIQGQASAQCQPATTGGKSLTGSVSGLGMTQLASINLGGSVAAANFAQTGFSLMNVQQGPLDLLASRISASAGGTVADKVILRRAQNFTDGAVIPVLAFASEGETPMTFTATVTGVASGETVNGTNSLVTPTTTAVLSVVVAGASTFSFAALPASALMTNDFHLLSGIASQTMGSVVTTRLSSFVFKGGADQTLALGPQLSTVTVSTAATAPYARLRAQFAKQTEYSKLVAFQWSQAAMTTRSGTILATDQYLGSTSTVDLAIPDFSALSGWMNSWAPVTGTSVTYGVTASGWTFTGGGFGNPLVAGTTIKTGLVSGLSFTP